MPKVRFFVFVTLDDTEFADEHLVEMVIDTDRIESVQASVADTKTAISTISGDCVTLDKSLAQTLHLIGWD